MSQDAHFAILFPMVPIWFLLVWVLHHRLRSSHPEKYAAMGSPSLFRRTRPGGVFTTFKFLFTREHRALGDPLLSWLADGMAIYVSIYFLLFLNLLRIIFFPG